MEFKPSRVSLTLSRDVFRRWYLVTIAVGLVFALLIPFLELPVSPSPTIVWLAYLLNYVFFNLNAISEKRLERENVGLMMPLLAAYLSFDVLAALILLLAGELLFALFYLVLSRIHPAFTGRRHYKPLLNKALREIVTLGGALLSGYVFYTLVGGTQPLITISRTNLPRLLLLLVTMLGVRDIVTRLWFPSDEQPIVSQLEHQYAQVYHITLDVLLSMPGILVAYEFQRGNATSTSLGLALLILSALGLRILSLSRGALDRRIDALTLLNITSKALAAATSQADLFTLVYSQTQRLMDAPLFYIATFDPTRSVIRYPLVFRHGQQETWPDRPWNTGPVETILKESRPLLSSDGSESPFQCPHELDGKAGPCYAYLGVPIQFQNLLYGVIAIQHPTRHDAYEITEQHVLETIATQAAIALRNMALRNETQQFTDGLVAVNHLSSIINASLELDEIVKQISSVSRELSRATSAAAFMQGRPGTPFQIAYSVNLPHQTETALALTVTEQLDHWTSLLDQPQGTIIDNLAEDPRAAWLWPIVEETGLHAMTVIPFVSMRTMLTERILQPKRDIIGFQVVLFDTPHTPGEYELQLLQMLANQAAIAAENTTLFEEAQENVRRLAYLAETARVFTDSLSLETVAQSVVQWTVEILDFDTATLTLWDRDNDVLDVQAHAIDYALPNPGTPSIHRPLDELPEFTEVLRHRWSQIFLAADEDLSRGMREVLERSGLQQLVLTPLVGRDAALGLILLGKMTNQPISGPDVELAESIASQVSIAIENARFYEFTENELTNRVQELNELEQVLRTISVSTQEEDIIHSVLEAARTITGAQLLACGLVSPDNGLRISWQLAENDTLMHRYFPDIHRGISGECIRNREPLVIDDTSQAPNYWVPDGTEGFASEMCVPILHQERILGFLNLESKRVNHFTQTHVRFVQSLAGHAAVAISRARLFNSNQRQIEILDTIRVLSLDLLQATGLEDVLREVCSVALNLIQGLNIHIYFYNPDNHKLTFGASLWQDGRRNVEVASPRPNGLTVQAIERGVTLISDDFERIPGVPTQRLGIFPLIYRGETVGALNAAVDDTIHMGENEIRALELLTNQAASAIERVRLFESRQRQLELQDALRRNSVTLLNMVNLERVQEIVCQSALLMVNAESVHIYYFDPESEHLSFASSLWQDGQRNIEANIPRVDGITVRTARSGQPKRLTGKELASSYQGKDVSLIQGIPLKHGGSVIGVLNVAVKDSNQLGPDEVRALELMANQAAAAILSVRLLEEIRAGRDQMQTILNTVRDGLMLVDQNGLLLRTNPAAELLLDIDLRPYVGQNLMRIVRQSVGDSVPPTDFRHLSQVKEMWQSLRDDPFRITTREVQVVKDGETIYLEEESAPVLSAYNEVLGRLFVWHDITDQHELQEVRENLTHTIVHDLRSPLTSIKGGLAMLIEMMGDTDLDPETITEVLKVSENSADRLLELVNSLLDVARLENEELPLNLSSATLNEPLAQTLDSLSMMAQENDIRLLQQLDDNLPMVFMDVDKVRRILINLIDNAIRHTPQGGRVIVMGQFLSDEEALLVTVDDSGSGVPPDLRDRVFEKFATGLTEAPNVRHRGLGLGLNFCKLAVEAHGGRIWIEDGLEGGAAFRFTLPI